MAGLRPLSIAELSAYERQLAEGSRVLDGYESDSAVHLRVAFTPERPAHHLRLVVNAAGEVCAAVPQPEQSPQQSEQWHQWERGE